VVIRKSLHAFASSNIPHFGSGITSTRYETLLVPWSNGHTHHIANVIGEVPRSGARFDIPQNAAHVSRASNNLAVAEEAAAREITNVRS